jgi:hypothetical protein
VDLVMGSSEVRVECETQAEREWEWTREGQGRQSAIYGTALPFSGLESETGVADETKSNPLPQTSDHPEQEEEREARLTIPVILIISIIQPRLLMKHIIHVHSS